MKAVGGAKAFQEFQLKLNKWLAVDNKKFKFDLRKENFEQLKISLLSEVKVPLLRVKSRREADRSLLQIKKPLKSGCLIW